MHKFFVKEDQINDDEVVIFGQDVRHINNVLRLKIGGEIQVCNKCNKENFICTIVQIDKEEIKCRIKKRVANNEDNSIHINIFQGLPKFEKMEWVIEKSTELGVEEVTPIMMKRSVVKLDGDNKQKKLERWRRIAEVAAKQSKRDDIPKINDIAEIEHIIEISRNYDIILLAYEDEKTNSLKTELKKLKSKDLKIGVIIGPEGGLDIEEVEKLKKNGIKVVTLGNRILRTETAGIAMISMIMYELTDIAG